MGQTKFNCQTKLVFISYKRWRYAGSRPYRADAGPILVDRSQRRICGRLSLKTLDWVWRRIFSKSQLTRNKEKLKCEFSTENEFSTRFKRFPIVWDEKKIFDLRKIFEVQGCEKKLSFFEKIKMRIFDSNRVFYTFQEISHRLRRKKIFDLRKIF